MKKVFLTRFVYDGRGFREIQLAAENQHNSLKHYVACDCVPDNSQLVDVIYKTVLFDALF